MFGFIHESIRQLILRNYGSVVWEEVLTMSGFENGKENIVNHYYNDNDTYMIVDSVSAITNMTREQVWELYGAFLIEYTMEVGWDEMVRTMSPNLKGFLDNLDSLHYFIDHVVYKANLRGPSFRCESNSDGTITLHYYTGRPGLYSIVRGVIREVAQRVFDIDVALTLSGRTQRSVQMHIGERVEEHVIFTVSLVGDRNVGNFMPVSNTIVESTDNFLRLSPLDISTSLPYHFIMDDECRLVFAGKELYNHIARELLVPGTHIIRLFEVDRPKIPLDFDSICNFINAVFVLQVRTSQTELAPPQREGRSITPLMGLPTANGGSESRRSSGRPSNLILKGQMMLLSSQRHLIYLGSPYVTSIAELLQNEMRLTDMPMHDATRDLILLNQQRLNDVEVNLELEANMERLEYMTKELAKQRVKEAELLADIFPASLADVDIHHEDIAPEIFNEASVLVADVPALSSLVTRCSPKELIRVIDDLTSRFDRLINSAVFKVETVCDSFTAVCGIPEARADHCEILCHAAIGILWESRQVLDPVTNDPLTARIGIHSGPIIAGVMGAQAPRYCILGDVVGTAELMKAHCPVGKIQLSHKAYLFASRTGRFVFYPREIHSIRGKGDVQTYYLLRSLKKAVWEIVQRKRDPLSDSIDGYDDLLMGDSSERRSSEKGLPHSSSDVASLIEASRAMPRSNGIAHGGGRKNGASAACSLS